MELKGALIRSLLACVMSLGLTLMAPQSARADWTYPGAQYSCNAQNHSFEVIPYEPTDEEPNLPPASGFQSVNSYDPSITCTLGNHVVHAQVETVPANEHHCMALGMVRLSSLTVQGVELLERGGESFNFTCDREESLKRIRVTLKGSELVFEQCYEPGDNWTTHSPKAHCDSQRMDIDSMAAANAKLAHSLADAATQAAASRAKSTSGPTFIPATHKSATPKPSLCASRTTISSPATASM